MDIRGYPPKWAVQQLGVGNLKSGFFLSFYQEKSNSEKRMKRGQLSTNVFKDYAHYFIQLPIDIFIPLDNNSMNTDPSGSFFF